MHFQPYHAPNGSHNDEIDWHAYQPSWLEIVVIAFGLAGLIGVPLYLKTGNIVALELAGFAGLLLCVHLRWIWPRFQHFIWGDPE